MENILTYEDYISWDDKIRYELVEGVRKIMAGVSEWHNRVSFRLSSIMDLFWDKKGRQKYFVFQSPFDVILFPDEDDILKSKTTVQPDFGICLKEKRDGRKIIGAPEFVIEIVSLNLDYDFRVKRDLYEKAGVLEYWVITPRENNITVYLLDIDKGVYKDPKNYELTMINNLKSAVIEGFEIDLSKIFDFSDI